MGNGDSMPFVRVPVVHPREAFVLAVSVMNYLTKSGRPEPLFGSMGNIELQKVIVYYLVVWEMLLLFCGRTPAHLLYDPCSNMYQTDRGLSHRRRVKRKK